ncbi:MAG TPA: NAD(P)/FAD-dependent oxidoreductase [Marmoricola sp.]|nr:NAD(P)/FAD-dependent oxidoreductase [Marmoricola sp.]HNJ77936.1 NAD(P)/FAD-dependent oxidoreductase [Marmoricola sp.]
MTQPVSTRSLPASTKVFVVGGGISGIGLAIKLNQAGHHDFVIADRGSTVGGTWRDNTYPGAACDVPSQLYSFSFAPNKEWSRSYSAQPEIQRYLEQVTDDFGVRDHFHFNTEVTRMAWDEDQRHWRISTSSGDTTAKILIVAAGSLSAPRLPGIEGIESFTGEIWHSARWNHDFDLNDKRLAVIGTGASAIQIIPEVAGQVARLDVYQRTAPWVIPRNDRQYGAAERAALRTVPGLNQLYRQSIRLGRETYVPAFTFAQSMGRAYQKLAEFNIARGLSKPELAQAVVPDYKIGCKRILISNDYYPALSREHVDLITEPISRITPTGIQTEDGQIREVDAIAVCTGFHTTDHPIAELIQGRREVVLAEQWRWHGASAYKGTTVPGFPNLFQITGPNTVLGHTSMIEIIEAQIGYILGALDYMDHLDLDAIEPKENLTRAYTHELRMQLKNTIWNTGGCSSWYLDQAGRNTISWPRSALAYVRQMHKFDADAYNITSARSLVS